jgi:hypothetical protein
MLIFIVKLILILMLVLILIFIPILMLIVSSKTNYQQIKIPALIAPILGIIVI